MGDHQDGVFQPQVTPCVSLCEVLNRQDDPDAIAELLSATCREAGFPGCERLYVGSYFCENFFLGITDNMHRAVRELCAQYDMGATLVVPIVGQAFLERADRRLSEVLGRFAGVYDEVVVNDVAQFLHVSQLTDARIGMGRLFQKEMRDARYINLENRQSRLFLSPEAEECAASAIGREQRPLVEVDPVSDIVDVSSILQAVPSAEIAIHLPYCLATTGRNCGPASVMDPPDQKFRLGQGCMTHCLRMAQGCLTREGVEYVKHGRSYYFANPSCRIAGTGSWRIVYAAAHETMR